MKTDYNRCRELEHDVITRVVMVCPQTHWSPAEYEEIEICTVCDELETSPEPDWDEIRDMRDGF